MQQQVITEMVLVQYPDDKSEQKMYTELNKLLAQGWQIEQWQTNTFTAKEGEFFAITAILKKL